MNYTEPNLIEAGIFIILDPNVNAPRYKSFYESHVMTEKEKTFFDISPLEYLHTTEMLNTEINKENSVNIDH